MGMDSRSPKCISVLLLAGSLAWARPSTSGPGGGVDGSLSGHDSGGIQLLQDFAKNRLDREIKNAEDVRSKFALQNAPEAAPDLQSLQDLIAQAQTAYQAANYVTVNMLCDRMDAVVALLYTLGERRLLDPTILRNTGGPGPGTGGDSSFREDQKAKVSRSLEQTTERFGELARRLESSKSQRASDLIDKVRGLIATANLQVSSPNPMNALQTLSLVEGQFPELSSLSSQDADPDKHGGNSGSLRDAFKTGQPNSQVTMSQAMDIYNRVHNQLVRLGDQNVSNRAQSSATLGRVQDFLDKCKEAIAGAHAETAKELALKAEASLAEWHQGATFSQGSGVSLQRLKIKMEKAREIVRASGNDKAVKILEKGQEHFDKAERNQADGQASRSQVEMDIALKLAAKAVDIARSNSAP